MFALVQDFVPKREKKEQFMLAIRRLPIYAWLLTAVAVLALALMFWDLPILGWAVLIVSLVVWAVREATAR